MMIQYTLLTYNLTACESTSKESMWPQVWKRFRTTALDSGQVKLNRRLKNEINLFPQKRLENGCA